MAEDTFGNGINKSIQKPDRVKSCSDLVWILNSIEILEWIAPLVCSSTACFGLKGSQCFQVFNYVLDAR